MTTFPASFDRKAVQPDWRSWTALVLLALPLFMMATDFTVMFMVMPSVAGDLAPTTTQSLWIMHIGEFVAAGMVITMGWLTGRIGARTLLLIAMALYGIASALAAFASNPEILLAGRVMIGMAGAAASPAAIAVLRSLFTDARYFGVAFAVVLGAFPVGAALGPPLGGVLLEHFWWGAVFLINVPVAAIVLAAGWWLFPRVLQRTTDRIDMTSVVLSLAAVILVVFGLQEIADQGWSLLSMLAALTGGALGLWFVRRQRRVENPLLDLDLFGIRALRVVALLFVVFSLAFVSVDFILVQYLQIVAGVPTAQLGLMLAVPGVAAIAGTALTPVLARRLAPGHVMALGVMLCLVGTVVIVTPVLLGPGATWALVTGTAIASLGTAPVMVLGAQLMVTSAPPDQSGSAVAIQDVSAGLGGALGMAFSGSIALAVFGRRLGATAPDAVTESDLDAAVQSPGGAVAVAERLGGASGSRLLEATQDALTWGTVTAYAAAFVLGVVTIAMILRGLRGIVLPSDVTKDG